MTTISFYFDRRRTRPDGLYPVRLSLASKGKKVYISTGFTLSQDDWDIIRSRRIPDRRLLKISHALDRFRIEAEEAALDLQASGVCATPEAVKKELAERMNPALKKKRIESEDEEKKLRTCITRRMEMKEGKTKLSIKQTLSRLLAFDPDVYINDVSASWLEKFDNFMAETSPSPNARAVHMRNLRAVFNFAIDEGITDNYPFRRYHIKTVQTAKRSLSVEELRVFLNISTDDTERKYLDIFKLMFLLIGINSVDLLQLKHDNLIGDRIEFNRSKTKRLYSIKVESEAMEIINKYRGERYLINPLDTVSNWEDYLRRLNKSLKGMGNTTIGYRGKKTKEAMFPQISSYWARHTWATIAASLDIPKETIAAALGHGGNTVTDIYINFDSKKIDEANRRVIDWVLYSKK